MTIASGTKGFYSKSSYRKSSRDPLYWTTFQGNSRLDSAFMSKNALTAGMPVSLRAGAMAYHRATNRFYWFGGRNSAHQFTTYHWYYSPNTNTWTQLTALPFVTGSSATTTVDDFIYLCDLASPVVFRAYDVASATFTTKSVASQVSSLNMETGKKYTIVSVGTTNWSAIGSTVSQTVGTVFTYNGTTPTGTGTIGIPQTPSQWHTIQAVGRYVYYLLGGSSSTDTYTVANGGNKAYRYDPDMDSWSTIASAPYAAGAPAAAAIYTDTTNNLTGGYLFMAYGMPDNSGAGLNTCALYDPSLDTWTSKTNSMYALNGVQGCGLGGGRAIFAGGSTSIPGQVGAMTVYSLQSNTWSNSLVSWVYSAWNLFSTGASDICIVQGNGMLICCGGYYYRGDGNGVQLINATTSYSIQIKDLIKGDTG